LVDIVREDNSMMTLFGPIVAAALMAQFQGGPLQGTVVDEQGKPVVDAQVVFHAPAPRENDGGPVEVRAKTDLEGRFRLTTPRLGGVNVGLTKVWADRTGSAITTAPSYHQPLALVMRKPVPRTVKIEGPDGQPVVGAKVYPRVVSVAGAGAGDVPDTLAAARTVTTGSDGRAMLSYLAANDLLVAVRVAADSIGTQDFPLIERINLVAQQATITLRLNKTSRLAGRIRNREGQPVANQAVEVWFFKGGGMLAPNPVEFKNGPIHTAADGSFTTPDNLLVGSRYRIVARAPGMEPILSDWITIGDKPRVLLPMMQRPLRTIGGRVVDRQGKPVLGVEVFQTGDGPERTATKTVADGRFALGGFMSQGPVFLFVRGEGFRFFGRLIKPGEADIRVELTRTSERPAHEMRMLGDAIPLEESRALARRLLEPCWKALETANDGDKTGILDLLAGADPVGVLGKLEEEGFPNLRLKSWIQADAAQTLARSDPAQAEAVAEAIKDPRARCVVLVAVADALPDTQRDRKLALLDRAAIQVKAATNSAMRMDQMGDVAEGWYELGEKEKAKTLFAEGLRLANQITIKSSQRRGRFAAQLARVDLPSALAIAKEFRTIGQYPANWVLCNIAFHLAADNPAEAERVLRLIPQETGRYWLASAIAWKLATVDPARARRLVEESQRYYDFPQMFLFLANGVKSRDPAAAQQAFQTAMHGLDRLMNEGVGYSPMVGAREVLLPLVEQIDPALVPELFWRLVATRPSVGNPRRVGERMSSQLVVPLAQYDRDVAAALFEPIRAQLEHTDDQALAGSSSEFLAWSIFDPRAAVARLEQVPVNPKLDLGVYRTRVEVAETLGLSHEARWRKIWSEFTEMREVAFPGRW
jgi:hypothetical protein